ncbi:MAG: preprotein translocase subunit SecA [Candidatus Omnitrophica bacterium]|nr:preprotein translocase subunit SecA [Candidatus Omnitrophota bacterium]
MHYYEHLLSDFQKLNLGRTQIVISLNRMFNKEKCCFMSEMMELLREINEKEEEIKKLSREEMRARTEALKKQIRERTPADECLVESFALVREAARRTLNMRHFDVQILGGMVLHKGKMAEMTTGEGKTLVATLPIFLNALEGKGCHLVTVNDYLAKRDTQWMGAVYNYLGLSIGCIISQKEVKGPYAASSFIFDPNYLPADSRFLYLSPAPRKQAYNCDITYGIGSEFGFDYLRDNMAARQDLQVQRGLNYAIIDEVDSILIDEARTPLIISGPSEETTKLYYEIDKLVRKLNKEDDYTLDEEGEAVSLTDQGIHKCERLMGIQNLYDGANTERVHHINQALRAHSFFKRDKEYVVKEGQVIIVDEFTGRLMEGRRWSDGLHQAIEAKEGVRIENENQTLATISFQNYFKLYNKIAGMTGTAMTEAVEFKEIYNTEVISLPTNKKLNRTEFDDEIYKAEKEKFNRVVSEIEEAFNEGRPVLVGTVSIEKAEKLSRMLGRKNIPHKVLHGKNHEAEAAIIAQAGKPKAITIATQMAGRGVDIILGGNPEILAREETIRVIWSRKKTGEKDSLHVKKEFAEVLGDTEQRYKQALADIDGRHKGALESMRAALNEKEKVFSGLDRKAETLFEDAVFKKQAGTSYERYRPRLLKLKELHDKASEDLAAAQAEFGDRPEKLKDFKESASRTYREYASFKNSLKERFGIVMDEDTEEKRHKMTELLNSQEVYTADGKKNIARVLETYQDFIVRHFSLLASAFADAGGFQKEQKKADSYLEYIKETSIKISEGKSDFTSVIEDFKNREGRMYASFLEAKKAIKRTITEHLLEEDFSLAEREYREALAGYEKELVKHSEEQKTAREAYEKDRKAHEEDWQKAREELEKTPEEFKEVYEQLLEQYKKPWLEDHKKVVEAGGLHVIGSERYEARRIDNQLKGRAGRQGDPGSSRFHLSLDDDLLRIFGSERMLGVMGHLPEGETIKHPLITKMITNAQKKVEARNFEIRKQLLEFDNVLNEQRKIIYSIRQDILEGRNLGVYVEEFIHEAVEESVEEHMSLQLKPFLWNLENFKAAVMNLFGIDPELPHPENIQNPSYWRETLKTELTQKAEAAYEDKKKEAGTYLAEIQKFIMLQVIDSRWKAHLRVIDELREGISLRAYAQRDPLLAYKHEGYRAFQEMLSMVKREILAHLFRVKVAATPSAVKAGTQTAPSQVTYSHKTFDQFDTAGKKQEPAEQPFIPSAGTATAEPLKPAPYTAGAKVGRNEPCPCGSGKKYKKCCGKNV